MLVVYSPAVRIPEREYIYRVMLEEFLGLSCRVEFGEYPDVEIELDEGGEASRLRVADVLLRMPDSSWLGASSLPSCPLDRIDPGHGLLPSLPVLYGEPSADGSYFSKAQDQDYCGVDVFGGAFFLLTRYEEVVVPLRDRHGRFPASASLAAKEGFLNRPLVNEYAELLWLRMSALWPGLQRPPRKARRMVSHDVDFAYYRTGRRRRDAAREALGDILRRKDLRSGLLKLTMLPPGLWTRAHDPFDTYDWLMEQSERQGLKSSFYFMTDQTDPRWDGNYTLKNPRLIRLLQSIAARGHEIGLHPSYDSSRQEGMIREQFNRLLAAAESVGIKQPSYGGRQHYLRWNGPDTWQQWEDAGLTYDSSLGYPEQIGFRAGACYEYPVFHLLNRRALRLRERPLLVMDQSVIHPSYMGLQGEEALSEIRRCYDSCMRYNGDFTLLWHNSQLTATADRKLYMDILQLR
ncbi:hypothetical protein DCC85_21060 [Paenibacillus sp. CAA11]|uniref:polysaccharide deacetylase family protein n=1 Tax=Paenibacillus sp. CAA11 TaxID=1532905 RepID=UPI000D38ABAD|nr:polysaccharide deacetylase family protein [Paenibacillus sp. CAA11]AWB46409.1 hypothetical protein DCC85_21060 [Paenibacillus sp. CAA11]